MLSPPSQATLSNLCRYPGLLHWCHRWLGRNSLPARSPLRKERQIAKGQRNRVLFPMAVQTPSTFPGRIIPRGGEAGTTSFGGSAGQRPYQNVRTMKKGDLTEPTTTRQMDTKRLRDPNDWRVGDVVIEGPDFAGSSMTNCHCCGRDKTWSEHWTYGTAGEWTPTVGKVCRVKGNVIRVVIGKRRGCFSIGPGSKRYILNPACKNGGYRTTNDPDPKYATDSQGRFIRAKATN